MKLIYILMLVLLNFNTCNAQKTTEIMMPEITKESEMFDIKKFEKENSNGLLELTLDQAFIEQENQNPGYISRIFLKNSFFMLSKKFYENGNIQEKAISFINGYPIKYWYKFDVKGNLIEEINTDEGYTYGWEQIIKYCEDNKIELTKGYVQGGYQTNIFKEELNGKKVWVISHLLSPILISKKTLDGITGELIKEEELEFINH